MLYRTLLQERLTQPDMTLRKLARDIDLYPSHLHRFLNTDTKPQGKTLTKLARYFGRTEIELIAGHEITEELIAFIRTMDYVEQAGLLNMLKQSQFLRQKKGNPA